MNVIWKFPLEITDRQPVVIPSSRRLLDIQVQGEQPCLWALVDPASPRTTIAIQIYGTGHPVSHASGEYIATFQTGPMVWHAFEVNS